MFRVQALACVFTNLTLSVAALPPDVRRGYASPVDLDLELGYALGSGLGPNIFGPEA